jgi:hypothetical protein
MEMNNRLNNIMNNLHNVAIHEAGHAVADCVLGHGLTPQGIELSRFTRIELSRFDDERFEGVVYANDSNPRDFGAKSVAYGASRPAHNKISRGHPRQRAASPPTPYQLAMAACLTACPPSAFSPDRLSCANVIARQLNFPHGLKITVFAGHVVKLRW